jgi:protein-disulfide isomerase
MTNRTLGVVLGCLVVIAGLVSFALMGRYTADSTVALARAGGNEFVRPHSPVIGREDAPVTIAEFFDPACEGCRAFFPVVKQILAALPNDVRLVLRYTPFHQGSEEAVRILEAARRQDKFEAVLEALLSKQPEWASHGAADLDRAWEIAAMAGLDAVRARRDATSSDIDSVLRHDIADAQTNEIAQTPTLFVNQRPLVSFGPQQLYDLVEDEVRRARSGR